MKKSHPAWTAFGFEAKPETKQPTSAGPEKPPIRMLDIAGIRSLEDKLIIQPPQEGPLSPELEREVDSVSLEIFGITEIDTEFEWPDGADESDFDAWKACDRYEEQFEFPEVADDKAIEMFERFGLDFTDERGLPLRCLRVLGRQAEAAAKNIKGRMPDRDALSEAKWASTLEQEVDHFLARKRQGTRR